MSNEAPKKIWMSGDTPWGAYERGYRDDIAYIRADLVNELVSALEDMINIAECSGNIVRKARDTLKKLEEFNGRK